MSGIEKSGLVLRIAPRSSATTCIPASDSSFARMPPVQPSPTITTSTSFRRVAMVTSREIEDAGRLDVVLFVAVRLDVLGVDRDGAGEADHLPRHLVTVAAVDRVRKEPLHREVQEQ